MLVNTKQKVVALASGLAIASTGLVVEAPTAAADPAVQRQVEIGTVNAPVATDNRATPARTSGDVR